MARRSKDRFEPHIVIVTAVSFIMLLEAIGTAFYMWAENWKFIDALYFSTTTLTTIGFGDHVPSSDLSKLFTIFFAFAGVGTVFFCVTLISEQYFRHKMRQMAHLENKIHEMMTPEKIKKEEEKIEEKAEKLEEKEEKLEEKEDALEEKQQKIKEEAEKVKKGKEKLKKIVKKI